MATGHVLDVPGIDHVDGNPGVFQGGVGAVPVDPGALHHHPGHPEVEPPRHPGAAIALEAAERAWVFFHGAVVEFGQDSEDIPHLMHVHSGNTAIKRRHERSPKRSLWRVGVRGIGLAQKPWRHRMMRAGHFTVRPRRTLWGTKGPGRIGLGVGIESPTYSDLWSARSLPFDREAAFMLGGERKPLMTG